VYFTAFVPLKHKPVLFSNLWFRIHRARGCLIANLIVEAEKSFKAPSISTTSTMSTVEHKTVQLEMFPGRTLSLFLFESVQNIAEIKNLLVTKQIRFGLINADYVSICTF
jgi:hypothetical protein